LVRIVYMVKGAACAGTRAEASPMGTVDYRRCFNLSPHLFNLHSCIGNQEHGGGFEDFIRCYRLLQSYHLYRHWILCACMPFPFVLLFHADAVQGDLPIVHQEHAANLFCNWFRWTDLPYYQVGRPNRAVLYSRAWMAAVVHLAHQQAGAYLQSLSD